MSSDEIQASKVQAIVKIAQLMYDKYTFQKAYLRHRFERWGPSTAKLYLEVMQEEGWTLVRRNPDDQYKLVSAARTLQRQAQEVQRLADNIDVNDEHGRSIKVMTLLEADSLNTAAEFLLEAANG